MKKARAHDLKSKEFVRVIRAGEMNEDLRHAYEYQCAEPTCSCTVHWRKAHSVNENTETRPAVFAKNPSSSHIAGCFYDFERIAEERQDYTYLENGAFHVRVNFPVGVSRSDVYPMRGYLTQQQTAAAQGTKHIQPFNSLTDLLKFIETNLGDLDRDDLPDLVLHYQGRTALFDDKLIGNLGYAKLAELAQPKKQGAETPSAITIVKPTHEIDPNDKGKRRFACEPQEVKINNRKHFIQPIIVSFGNDRVVEGALDFAGRHDKVMAVMARPFSTGLRLNRYDTPIYLSVGRPEQLTEVSAKYWRVPTKPQLDLFDAPLPSSVPQGVHPV